MTVIIQFVSFKFNGYLLTCKLNSTSVYDKASTNAAQKQYTHAKTKSINAQSINSMTGKKAI
jgi:hypothetical protein